MIAWRLSVTAAAAVAATNAMAQQGSRDNGAAALQDLAACRAVPAADARLACYEKTSAVLEKQVRDKQVRLVDHQDIRKAKRSLFGFTLPRIDLFSGERDDNRDEFSELKTTVVAASPLPNGRVQLRVAEGDAVWATTEPTYPPKPGASVRIRRGALGNYFIAIAGDRSVRAMRVR